MQDKKDKHEWAESANRMAVRDVKDKYCAKSAGRKTREVRIFLINVKRYIKNAYHLHSR